MILFVKYFFLKIFHLTLPTIADKEIFQMQLIVLMKKLIVLFLNAGNGHGGYFKMNLIN